jgi:phage shock protein PspC (stress-responsive transcriptional regulator)
MIRKLKSIFELNAFGVCARLAEKMGIATTSVRLFFIYISFLTIGSPVIMYLALAFVMNMRTYLRGKRSYYYEL